MKAALVIGLLLVLVGVAALSLTSHNPSPGDARPQAAPSGNAAETADNAAKLAVDGAIAGTLLSSFDDAAMKRNRAQAWTLRQLESIQLNTTRHVASQATRAANTMVSVPFVRDLAWASGRDFFDDHNRAWTLFDHALAGTAQTLQEADSAFSHQRSMHAQRLQQDQNQYWSTLQSRGVSQPTPVRVPQARRDFQQNAIKPRIMSKVNARLRSKFPSVIRAAAVKLGKKQLKRGPSAALDGPFPIVETALVL